jgi:hypothetical protein
MAGHIWGPEGGSWIRSTGWVRWFMDPVHRVGEVVCDSGPQGGWGGSWIWSTGWVRWFMDPVHRVGEVVHGSGPQGGWGGLWFRSTGWVLWIWSTWWVRWFKDLVYVQLGWVSDSRMRWWVGLYRVCGKVVHGSRPDGSDVLLIMQCIHTEGPPWVFNKTYIGLYSVSGFQLLTLWAKSSRISSRHSTEKRERLCRTCVYSLWSRQSKHLDNYAI